MDCTGFAAKAAMESRAERGCLRFPQAFTGDSRNAAGMCWKYKMLWFVVDMHHRWRYFFICGCKHSHHPAVTFARI
jgi:hypothetical protein